MITELKDEDIIERFEEFIRNSYMDSLRKTVEKGYPSLNVKYGELDKFDPELTDFLCEQPARALELFSNALKKIDITEENEIKVRIAEVPEHKRIKIRNIRSKDLGKLITIEGLIRQTSDVRPVMSKATFECPICGTYIDVEQNEFLMKEPSLCVSCGRKGKFKLFSKTLIDTQRLVIEETPDHLSNDTQPRKINVFLTDDLIEPKLEKKTSPGTRVIITGITKEIPIIDHGTKSTRFDLIIQANNIEVSEKEFSELEITPEDINQIKNLASDPDIMNKLVRSIAPSIYGYETIKEAIILQLFGGERTQRPDNTSVRGDIHILLVGDPGVAKSQMLKYIFTMAPKARYVSGKSASGAGITASVVKDEFLKGWSLEAGALVLANKGICLIDEIDKMDKEDRSAMHEAMEQQTVTISKANIHSTLKAETTILAAANPKLGRFDPYQPLADQIDMPPTLISRFDLLFTLRDIPEKERDTRLAQHILNTFKNPQKVIPEIEPDILRKYIAYAKKNVSPKLSDEAILEIQEFFVGLRSKRSKSEEEGGVKPIPISARQLEALVRLAQASARVRLSNNVTQSDAKRAINLLKSCLMQVGLDTETGELDIDRIVTGITATQRNKIIQIRDIIKEMETKFGSNIPLADVLEAAKAKGIDVSKAEEIIEKMKREGEIFEPKHGIIRKMPR